MQEQNDINYESFCTENKPDPCGLVIFGASGDLTRRKLLPALFSLFERQLMPEHFFVIGCGRSTMSDTEFRTVVRDSLRSAAGVTMTRMNPFTRRCFYVSGDYKNLTLYKKIKRKIATANRGGAKYCDTVFYLSTPPAVYQPIVEMLGETGLVNGSGGSKSCSRVVIEKPFGRNLSNARELDNAIHRVLSEDQIYRIDHYLGKETVQNMLIFRFANAIFEPIWNRRYIDNVQILVSETLGVEHRAGYFEQAGLLRDMFQNHMLQMLSLVAMEAPASFEADHVRDEKVKLLRAVRPFPLDDIDNWIVRGQYQKGKVDGRVVPGYCEEPGVAPDSNIETFVSTKLMIDNWRWQGVPFHLSSGKRLPKRLSEIAIVFKEVPHSMFKGYSTSELSRNLLIMNVQPHEGISLRIEAKHPGAKLCMKSLNLDFRFRDVFGENSPDAYERLLLDCMTGDQTLFIRKDDMEVAWSLFTPILDIWRDNPEASPLYHYPAGSWGLTEARRLLAHEQRYWRLK
ncbi:glucose-6-phosphate dehydrogenase [Candidatus Latescibacterota bacterium]